MGGCGGRGVLGVPGGLCRAARHRVVNSGNFGGDVPQMRWASLSPVRATQRLQPVRIMLVCDRSVEAVVALSDMGRYVNVDARPFSEDVLPRRERHKTVRGNPTVYWSRVLWSR